MSKLIWVFIITGILAVFCVPSYRAEEVDVLGIMVAGFVAITCLGVGLLGFMGKEYKHGIIWTSVGLCIIIMCCNIVR